MNRIDIINLYIKKYDYKSYLEIGVSNGECFKQIMCEKKVGVDPYPSSAATIHKTSDDYFKDNEEMFDIIFIDGLHHSEQVHADIINSLKFLNKNGTILMHDCLPDSKWTQEIPLTNQANWTGDCWREFLRLRTEREDLEMSVIDTDWGVGIIKEGTQELVKVYKYLSGITYEDFEKNKNEWMNIKSVEHFIQNILK